MVQNLEISAAVYDPDQGSWQPAVDLTNNGYIDSAPRLSGQGDNVLLTWVGNVDNALRGNSTSPNNLFWSNWNGTDWTEADQAVNVPYGLINYDLNFNGTRAIAVLSLDTDDNATSINDQELFSCAFQDGTWGSLVQVTDNTVSDTKPQLARDQDGNLILVWYQDGDVVSISEMDLTTRQVITSDDYSTNQADFNLAASSNGQLAVTWAEASEYSSDIYAVFYDPIFGVWGRPKRLTEDAETEQYLTADFSNPEDLMVVYDRTQVEVEKYTRQTLTGRIISYEAPTPVTTDLYMAKYDLHGDLATKEMSFTPGNPAPGSEVQIKAQITNQGDKAVDDLPVVFYNGDPSNSGEIIGQTSLAGTLRPGDNQEASLVWTVPETDSALDIFAVADPDNTVEDIDRTNNQVNGTILAPDLSFATMSWQHIGGTTYEVSCRVKNIGPLASGESNLVFRKGAPNGQVIGSHSLSALDSLASVEVPQTVDMTALSRTIYVMIDSLDAVDEYDETNNQKSIVLSAKDSDGDGLSDGLEDTTCTEPNDADSDEDGIIDGDEDINHNGQVDPGETDPCAIDTDNDGLQDGTEMGLTEADVGEDTNLDESQPDLDPSTTTEPLDHDTDGDGLSDGEEDANQNGRVDEGESDPNVNKKAMPWLMLLLSD